MVFLLYISKKNPPDTTAGWKGMGNWLSTGNVAEEISKFRTGAEICRILD
jgi:hypothetical protein